MGAVSRYAKPLIVSLPKIWWWWVTWLKKYSQHPEKYPLDQRYKKLRSALISIKDVLNVDLYVDGLENVPTDENICLVGNHLSDFDPFVITALMEQPMAFLGKIEIKQTKMIPEAMTAVDSVFIDRNDLKQSLKCMLKIQNDMLNVRKNWLIFPEGTRVRDSRHRTADFHPGTFRTPMKAGVTICPFALMGTDRVFKPTPTYKRYPVFIKFLKPITKSDYENKTTDEIARFAHDEVERALSFDLRTKDHALMSKLYGKKKYHLI